MAKQEDKNTLSYLVSIVIPVYNIPIDLLQRSVNSVLAQNYNDIELIIIDDGSCDETANACDELIELDQRIRVIHQSNAGVSAARNRGIDEAQGEYLMFVDADDELLPDILADAVSVAWNNDLDILYGAVIDRTIHGDQIRKPGLAQNETLRIYSDKTKLSVVQEYFLAYETPDSSVVTKGLNAGVYNKLFKRSVIGSVHFDENITILEDTIFNSEVVANASRIGLQDKLWYIYYRHDHSALRDLSIDKNADVQCTAVLQHASDGHLLNACYMHICSYLFLALKAASRRRDKHLLKTIRQAINRPCFKEPLTNVDWKRYELNRSSKLRYSLAQSGNAFFLMICYRVRHINGSN